MFGLKFFHCGAIVALASLLSIPHTLFAQDDKPRIVIGKDTTYIDSPLTEDGYIDYIRYVNEKQSDGVAAKDNVVAAIAKIVPEGIANEDFKKKLLKALKISSIAKTPNCFVSFYGYTQELRVKASNSLDDKKRWQALLTNYNSSIQKPWTAEQFPSVAKWLAENERYLDLAIRAAKRKKYFQPVIRMEPEPIQQTLITTWSGFSQQFRQLGVAFVARALLHAGNGDFKNCLSDLRTVRRLGRHIGSGMVQHEKLIGIALMRLAANAEIAIATAGIFTEKQLLEVRDQTLKLGVNFNFVETFDQHVRFLILDNMQFAQRNGFAAMIDQRILYGLKKSKIDAINQSIDFYTKNGTDWAAAKKYINGEIDAYVELLKIDNVEEYVERQDEWSEKMNRLSIATTESNFYTKLLLIGPKERGLEFAKLFQILNLRNPGNFFGMTSYYKTMNDIAAHVLTIEAFKAKNGAYPVSLKDLKSEPALPTDPFTRKPYIYRKTRDGFVVYGVGMNAEDDGGECDATRGYNAKDWGIQIPLRDPVE